MRLFKDASYKFIQQRRKAYVVSAAGLLVGIAAMIFFAATGSGWVNYGVDFTGGTIIQVEFAESQTVGDVRDALGTMEGVEITQFGDDTEYLIRVPEFSEQGTNVSEVLSAILAEEYGDDGYQVVRTEAVGPKIGAELQQRALLAILLSFGLTLIYLAFRFEWKFGVAAVIATVHDILIALGFIALFRIEVSLSLVAAILTVIGYSLNDTIVVFDRIRENLGSKGRSEAYTDLVNRSINDTLPRTIMTSVTTLVVLLSLFLLGGDIIRDFALILILGVLVGTYSSIFVASPALLEIEQRSGEEGQTRTRGRAAARA
ncbi:MAG TPA: protein translocase subunit SecF [Longimicrobiales bacterium]|nr:protein translocase subunit SecF [Longimicrobiales bacterium]